MNDYEQDAFRLCYEFYAKWREEILETEDQWKAFADALGELAAKIGEHWTPIGQHLFDAVIDGISDLYMDGRKPMPAGYFGKDEFDEH